MDFDRVFNILKDEYSREEFLVRLKQVGETSQEFQSLSKIMLSLGMDRTPRFYETTILQNTFTFSEPFECFTKFRLVCKSWKFAVETKPRFDHIDSKTMEFINKCPGRSYRNRKLYVTNEKIIQSLKNIEMKEKDVIDRTFASITKCTRNLTSFSMPSSGKLTSATYESSVLELLRNSYQSLRELTLPIFIFPQNLNFSNLTKVTLNFCDEYETLSLHKFQLQFQNLLAFAPNIKIIETDLEHVDQDAEDDIEILDFIGTTYGKYCVICFQPLGDNGFKLDDQLLNHIPLKIVKAGACLSLDELASMKYADQIQYLQLETSLVNELGDATSEWHNYKIILQSFTSLKGFCILYVDEEFMSQAFVGEKEFYENQEFMVELGENSLEFWRTRINYMKSIGIKILDKKEFDSMEENVSKTIPWRFHFDAS